MNPLVSVIMPAYNAEKYIEEAIQSVLYQTYENLELVIVVDSSTDNTLDKILKFQDSRIRLAQNKKNEGISYSTNKAIQMSCGKYLALLDDDDVSMPDRIKKQVNYLEKNKAVDILGGRTIYIDEKSDFVDVSVVPRMNPQYMKCILLLGGVDFSNSTAMIRRSFLERTGIQYQDNCYGMQDVRFYMEASKVGTIVGIKDYLLKYRMHSENETTKNIKKYGKERSRKFAELQRYSIEASGFHLETKEFDIINKAFPENGGNWNSATEMIMTHRVLKHMLEQAAEMKMDYLWELNHYFRRKFGELIIKYQYLFDDKTIKELYENEGIDLGSWQLL